MVKTETDTNRGGAMDNFSITLDQFDSAQTKQAQELDAQAHSAKLKQHALAIDILRAGSSLMTMAEAMQLAAEKLHG